MYDKDDVFPHNEKSSKVTTNKEEEHKTLLKMQNL